MLTAGAMTLRMRFARRRAATCTLAMCGPRSYLALVSKPGGQIHHARRGHGPGALEPRQRARGAGRPEVARLAVGRGPGGRGPVRALLPERAPRDLQGAHRAAHRRKEGLPLLLHEEELDAQREALKAKNPKANFVYPGTCRDRTDEPDLPFVVRFRSPTSGSTDFTDRVFGFISTPNSAQQDFVLMRRTATRCTTWRRRSTTT